MPTRRVKGSVPRENPTDRTATMDFSTYTQHSRLTRVNAQRLERETELRRRNAETMAARAAEVAEAEPRMRPARVIRCAWRLVTSHG